MPFYASQLAKEESPADASEWKVIGEGGRGREGNSREVRQRGVGAREGVRGRAESQDRKGNCLQGMESRGKNIAKRLKKLQE